MTDTFKREELDASDLEELGIDPPRDFVEAYRNDEDTITVMVIDDSGQDQLDAPCDDHSGEDAWEWIQWDSGDERDEWIGDNFCCAECGASNWGDDEPCPSGYEESDKHRFPDAFRPGLDFWIERYEHGLVRYAPAGESSVVDRRWDVASGVALMRFTKPDTIGPDSDPDKLLNFARDVCEEYTSWCNGDIYGMIRFERRRPIDAPHCPLLIPDEYTEDSWEETDSCWGFIGSTYASETAKTGGW